MKKRLIAGAALLLAVGMGTTSMAAGRNLLTDGGLSSGWRHHVQHSARCETAWGDECGGSGCVVGRWVSTSGTHHAEPDDHCEDWAGDCAEGAVRTVSCHVENGYCWDWVDADSDDLCDVCGNPVCHDTAGRYGTAQPQGNGYVLPQTEAEQPVVESDNSVVWGNQNQNQDQTQNQNQNQGYGSYGSGYGYGSSGHHGSSHHGSGHHR